MRIFIHDFGSYPFPFELSQSLARRGHDVLHVVSASEPARTEGFVPNELRTRLRFERLKINREFSRSNFWKRWRWSRAYGKAIAELCIDEQPDVVISANTPLDSQKSLWKAANSIQCPKVYWLQDLLGLAATHILSEKLPVAGGFIGAFYERVEKSLLRDSNHVVAITEGFDFYLRAAQVPGNKVSIIENWAPLEQLPLVSSDNALAREYKLDGFKCLTYSGLLGMKHNPMLIVKLAEALRHLQDVRIVLSAIGTGVDLVRAEAESRKLTNIIEIPFPPFSRLPELMAASYAMLALLEEHSGTYCVPSKVLTYLCGGRPVLMSAPLENLSSRLVLEHHAGVVCETNDTDGFLKAAQNLLNDPNWNQYGKNARGYAESAFQIETIADRFEEILVKAIT
jgi:colanic acid biosynthesis glycosyl transferase WcaI